MKKSRIRGVITIALMSAMMVALFACGSTTNDTQSLETEAYSPSFEAEFLEYAQDQVEIKKVVNPPSSFSPGEVYYVDFDQESMALSVPLSVLDQAESDKAYIVMRYQYPAGSSAESISFYIPSTELAYLYYPEASTEDLSLLVSDVVVSESQAKSIKNTLSEQGNEVSESAPTYSVAAYLVCESESESSAVRLESLSKEITMRERGLADASEVESRLYLSSSRDVYKPITVAYTAEDGKSFVDTYFYGSFASTQAVLPQANYQDISGHYAESAIQQVQLSYNMAQAITEGSEFSPDSQATSEDVCEAIGAFMAAPLANDAAYEKSKEQILAEYPEYAPLIKADAENFDYLLKNYVARMPYGLIEAYQKLEEADSATSLIDRGHAINARIDVAMLELASAGDVLVDAATGESKLSLPDKETTDIWLTGITDIAEDDPIRPYAAMALHYGLLFPDKEGKLNPYSTITRADLCLSFANLGALFEQTVEKADYFEGYTQSYLYARDANLLFDVTGTWSMVGAERVDGSTYTKDEVAQDDASFSFALGESLEKWENDEYKAVYYYSAQERTITICYEYRIFEVLEVSEDLKTLKYVYENEEDPEFNGEIYYFEREIE
ncbi:MAG: hypothetical protein ACOYD7_03785 [Raoultibacter sp.]|jgi:hypothetical protein